MKTLPLLTLVALLTLPTGCAFNKVDMADGERHVTTRTYALWPATTELARQKASAGKTLTLGTEGLREDSGSTNLVDALRVLDSLIGKIR